MARSVHEVLEELNGCSEAQPVPLGPYDVVRPLGAGGMGTVYEAIDRQRGVRVALKTLLDADPAASIDLKREFRIAADLAHPNLAPLHEFVEVDGLHFFTMALVQGQRFSAWARQERYARAVAETIPLSRSFDSPPTVPTLQARPAQLTPLTDSEEVCPPERSFEEIRRGFLQLARGLIALHDVGLFHGDIKPSNILVDDDDRVVLVDFGLSGLLEDRAPVGTSGGTPPYMAPEQLRGAAPNAASDWYALGVMLYRILTGRYPFRADSMLDLLFRKRHRPPPAPHDLLPEVPTELSALCMQLLRANSEERPSQEAILQVLDGAGVDALERRPRGRAHEFVGREDELCLLEHAYGRARARDLTRVHVRGTSGIGKTALLRSFLDGVHDLDDALIFRGRCYERESMPYKAFDRVVDEIAIHLRALPAPEATALLPMWTPELATMFPALRSVEGVRSRLDDAPLPNDALELRRRAWAGLADLLDALQLRRTVVIHIDDLQWIDADSADLLEELFGRERAAAVLLVLSFRPEADNNPLLADYFAKAQREPTAVPIDVQALPPAEAAELARLSLRDIGADAGDERVRYIAQEAGGVPFFVEELAHFVSLRGATSGGKTSRSSRRFSPASARSPTTSAGWWRWWPRRAPPSPSPWCLTPPPSTAAT